MRSGTFWGCKLRFVGDDRMAKLIEITGKPLSGEWGTDDEIGNGTPVLRTTNFTNQGVVDFSNVVTRNLGKKDVSGKFLKHGDILIEKSGGGDNQPVGRVIFFDGPEDTYLFNNFTGLLRVRNHQHWFPKYVFYVLYANYRFGRTRLFENRTTGLHNLQTDSYVSKTEIRETDLENQIEICDILDRLNGVIKSRQNQLRIFDTFIKARFVEMFGDLALNPYGWQTVTIADVSTCLKSGLSRKLSDSDIGLPMIRSVNIQNGQFVFDDVKYWYKDDPEGANTADYVLDDGDILINFINSISQIGKVAVFRNVGRACIYTPNIVRMKLTSNCNKYFYNWFAMTEYYFDQLKHIIQPAVNQASFTTVNYLNLKIPLPPIERQKEFERFVTQIEKSKAVVQKALDEAQTLFDSLMQQYFG